MNKKKEYVNYRNWLKWVLAVPIGFIGINIISWNLFSVSVLNIFMSGSTEHNDVNVSGINVYLGQKLDDPELVKSLKKTLQEGEMQLADMEKQGW